MHIYTQLRPGGGEDVAFPIGPDYTAVEMVISSLLEMASVSSHAYRALHFVAEGAPGYTWATSASLPPTVSGAFAAKRMKTQHKQPSWPISREQQQHHHPKPSQYVYTYIM